MAKAKETLWVNLIKQVHQMKTKVVIGCSNGHSQGPQPQLSVGQCLNGVNWEGMS